MGLPLEPGIPAQLLSWYNSSHRLRYTGACKYSPVTIGVNTSRNAKLWYQVYGDISLHGSLHGPGRYRRERNSEAKHTSGELHDVSETNLDKRAMDSGENTRPAEELIGSEG